jgi:Prephenate dehydrogenase
MANSLPVKLEGLKVSIIGLGLIGGSLARAFNERLGIREITAVNRSTEALEEALRDKSIKRGITETNEHVYDSDIVFICTPVKRTIEYIDTLSLKVKKNCIITDVGSTKGELARYVNSMKNPISFIGGHPMAGTEKTGYSSSFSHLFENAYYVLTPCKNTSDQALDTMMQIVNGIGAIPVVMDADEHDRVTGGISHLPHVIASALVNLVKDLDTKRGNMHMLAAGGFRDITRIASSSPEMWENIVSSNRTQLRELLTYFEKILDKFKQDMESGNSKKILDFFSYAKEYRDSMSTTKKGLLPPSYEIIIDVVDKPGIIGEIATILGSNNINIKNINVTNNREFEQGCLIITLPDSDSVNIAFDLLTGKGYKIYRHM